MQLVGNHVDSTVNNPIEAVSHWRGGQAAGALRVRQQALDYKEKITDDMAWSDIPTCKEQGLDIDYPMLRGIFMSPGATKEQVDYYIDLFKKVRETPEWQELMAKGAFNQTFMTGDEFKMARQGRKAASDLMTKAGFLGN